MPPLPALVMVRFAHATLLLLPASSKARTHQRYLPGLLFHLPSSATSSVVVRSSPDSGVGSNALRAISCCRFSPFQMVMFSRVLPLSSVTEKRSATGSPTAALAARAFTVGGGRVGAAGRLRARRLVRVLSAAESVLDSESPSPSSPPQPTASSATASAATAPSPIRIDSPPPCIGLERPC